MVYWSAECLVRSHCGQTGWLCRPPEKPSEGLPKLSEGGGLFPLAPVTLLYSPQGSFSCACGQPTSRPLPTPAAPKLWALMKLLLGTCLSPLSLSHCSTTPVHLSTSSACVLGLLQAEWKPPGVLPLRLPFISPGVG